MIFHNSYADVPQAEIEALFADAPMGRLCTVTPDGGPRIGLYPFVRNADGVELHVPADDEQVGDLWANARCVFEVDDCLSTIPSDWVGDGLAVHGDCYYRFVALEGTVTLTGGEEVLAAHLDRLLARYQPGVPYRPLRTTAAYGPGLKRLTLVRVVTTRTRVKFKLGQNNGDTIRERIEEQLTRRSAPEDLRVLEFSKRLRVAAQQRTPRLVEREVR